MTTPSPATASVPRLRPAPRALAAQLAGAGYCAGVSFALTVFLARVLPLETFGVYGALTATAALALIAIECGWPALIYRETVSPSSPDAPAERLFANGLAHAWTCAAVLAIAAMVSGFAWTHGVALAAALACMGFAATCNLVSARMRGGGRFVLEAAWQATGRTASAVAIAAAALLAADSTVTLYAAWALGLGAVIAAWGWRWLVRPSLSMLGARYPLVIPLVAMEATAALLLRGDLALFGALAADGDALAYYAACTRITEACLLMCAPFGNVLLRSFRLQRAAAAPGTLARDAALFAACAGSIAWALAAWRADDVIALLFGARYAAAADLLPWLTSMLPFALANAVLLPAVVANGCESLLLRRIWIASAVLVAAVAVGALWAQARGAAIGATLAHATLTALYVRTLMSSPRCASP